MELRECSQFILIRPPDLFYDKVNVNVEYEVNVTDILLNNVTYVDPLGVQLNPCEDRELDVSIKYRYGSSV